MSPTNPSGTGPTVARPITPSGTDPTIARPAPPTHAGSTLGDRPHTDPRPDPRPPRADPGPTPPPGSPPASGLRRLALLATFLAAASLLLAVVVRGRLAAVHRDLDDQRARCTCCTEAP